MHSTHGRADNRMTPAPIHRRRRKSTMRRIFVVRYYVTIMPAAIMKQNSHCYWRNDCHYWQGAWLPTALPPHERQTACYTVLPHNMPIRNLVLRMTGCQGCQIYTQLLSNRALPPYDQQRTILLGNRGTCVCVCEQLAQSHYIEW